MINLNEYARFVDAVTSDESKNWDDFMVSLDNLDTMVNMPRLLTAGIGLASETGEFNEIIKKCLFQGKPLNDETLVHMKKELGDVIWYWMQACHALDVDPYDVISTNIDKLKSRYPGGEFSITNSENRKEGDI
jgi:NTP pyrophosphatase (non-canonical NTP hydrolase)